MRVLWWERYQWDRCLLENHALICVIQHVLGKHHSFRFIGHPVCTAHAVLKSTVESTESANRNTGSLGRQRRKRGKDTEIQKNEVASFTRSAACKTGGVTRFALHALVTPPIHVKNYWPSVAMVI